MFTPGAHFCIFCWWQQKTVIIWKKHLCASERSYFVLSENATIGLLDSELPLARYKHLKIESFVICFTELAVSFMLLLSISHERPLQNLWTISFSERTQKDLLGALFNCSIHWYLSFLHLKIFKRLFYGVPPLHLFWSVKYTFTCQRWYFQPC